MVEQCDYGDKYELMIAKTTSKDDKKTSKYLKYKFLMQGWAIGLAFALTTCAVIILFKIMLLAVFLRSKVKEIFDFNLLKSFIAMTMFVLLTWTLYKIYLYGTLEHNTNIDQGLEPYKTTSRQTLVNDIIKNKDLILRENNVEEILKQWKDTELFEQGENISAEIALSHIILLRKQHKEGLLDVVALLENTYKIVNDQYTKSNLANKKIDSKAASFNDYRYYTGTDFEFKHLHLKYLMSITSCTLANDDPEQYAKIFHTDKTSANQNAQKLLSFFRSDKFFELWAKNRKSTNSVMQKAKDDHDGLGGQHGALYYKKEYNKDKRTLLITVTFAAILMSLNKFEEIICNKFDFKHSLSKNSIIQHLSLTTIKLVASLIMVFLMVILFTKFLEKPLDRIVASYQAADFTLKTENRKEVFSYNQRHNLRLHSRPKKDIKMVQEAFNPLYELLVGTQGNGLLTKDELKKEDYKDIEKYSKQVLALEPKSMLHNNAWEAISGNGEQRFQGV